jgi:cobalamin biosynthesis protein CobW
VVVHKTDGLDAPTLAGVEAAIRAETAPGVKLVHAQHGRIDIGVLLGLERAVEDAIDQRKTHHDEEEDHDHDAFDSVQVTLEVPGRDRCWPPCESGRAPRDLSRQGLCRACPASAMRLVVQGVGTRFDSYFDRPWRADEARQSRLVLIGLRAS